MTERACPVCNNHAPFKFSKQDTEYYQCWNCKMIFSNALPQEGLVGGGAEIERNTQQNHLRIERIEQMVHGRAKENVFILDWGAGNGYLIEDLKAVGFDNTHGYDLYNPKYEQLPDRNKYDVIVSIECVEHMHAPFIDFKGMYRSLKDGGKVYFETGFLNAPWDEGVSDEDNPYINPAAGHCTIWTHHSMDLIMALNGFYPLNKFNRHAHVYLKK